MHDTTPAPLPDLTPSASFMRRHRLLLGVLGLAVIIAASGGGFLVWQVGRLTPQLPAGVVEQVLFPMYLPRELPAGYQLDKASARVQDGVVLFAARDEAGHTIAFTEQARPKDFDFNAFYQQQLNNPRNLQGTPFPSIMGRTDQGVRLLSITTDATWLIITSKTASEDELRQIAQLMRKR